MTTIDMSTKPVYPTQVIFDTAAANPISSAKAIPITSHAYAAVGSILTFDPTLITFLVTDSIYIPGKGIYNITTANPVTPGIIYTDCPDGDGLNGAVMYKVSDLEASVISRAPYHVQIDALGAGTEVTLQCKLTQDGDWIDVITYNSTDTPAIYVFGQERINFVRARRSLGAGDVKVYTQG